MNPVFGIRDQKMVRDGFDVARRWICHCAIAFLPTAFVFIGHSAS